MWIETRTYPTIETTKQREIKKQQERLVKQFKEALYKRFEWGKLRSDLLNRYFWKMVEEIKNNPELNKDFVDLVKHPSKLKRFINSIRLEIYNNKVISIGL